MCAGAALRSIASKLFTLQLSAVCPPALQMRAHPSSPSKACPKHPFLPLCRELVRTYEFIRLEHLKPVQTSVCLPSNFLESQKHPMGFLSALNDGICHHSSAGGAGPADTPHYEPVHCTGEGVVILEHHRITNPTRRSCVDDSNRGRYMLCQLDDESLVQELGYYYAVLKSSSPGLSSSFNNGDAVLS